MSVNFENYPLVEMDNENYFMVPMEKMLPLKESLTEEVHNSLNRGDYEETIEDSDKKTAKNNFSQLDEENYFRNFDMMENMMNPMYMDPMMCNSPYRMDNMQMYNNNRVFEERYMDFNEDFNGDTDNENIKKMKTQGNEEDRKEFSKEIEEGETTNCNFRHDLDIKDLNRVFRKIQNYNPGIYRTLFMYGVPYYEANRIIKRIIRLTLTYIDEK